MEEAIHRGRRGWSIAARDLIGSAGHLDRVQEVLRLWKRRDTGPQIALRVGLSSATVARSWLDMACLVSRTSSPKSRSSATRENGLASDPRRYQEAGPYRLCRTSHPWGLHEEGSWHRLVHVAIDDASRLAYAEVLPNERSPSSTGFLRRSVAWFQKPPAKNPGCPSHNGSYASRVPSHLPEAQAPSFA